ncbi:exodeoxyribonuclease V subunit gamma [Aliiglaciecola sp. LCG003]|uniref:exodeoxyribonuclease V subunit gamma n=1 Tax=Aliiglaciecola sp. LCG003 TaxID=3053655 RepID=UPI002572C56A|nr:exodeoxyribonuclease V subunit gamma [Aliiglaciecola sp. LCG003]WJG07930.1 exodeoxyribonuclease V subunit gamma [Aliiglaciecola sp. LCG003]
MLHLIQSNKMENLQAQLLEQLSRSHYSDDGLADLLTSDTIIVQSPGMAQWLKINIAQTLGIAANLVFPLPSSFIWQQYQHYFDDLPDTSAFTKSNMAWKLMSLLPQLLPCPEFKDIEDYLAGDRGLKFYQLCQKIADVFDQYQVYRPDWINDWQDGSSTVEATQLQRHHWQPLLWRELVNSTQALGESLYHRANLHHLLLNKIAQTKDHQSLKPLYIFGISTLPQQQLEVFEALAQHREVFLFWCNPSQHYWGDIVDEKMLSKRKLKQLEGKLTGVEFLDVGNPLLASWGKPGRDYLEMLLLSDAQQHDAFDTSQPHNLVQWLQYEVLQLSMRNTGSRLSAAELLSNGSEFPKIPIDSQDDSLQIHSCHSKVRELEVLHNYLLQQFSLDSQLSPADIVVMMPDVASYAPYIEGVFGSAVADLFIPFGISDRNAAQESSMLENFMDLLNLHQHRFGLSELLSYLEVPAVQQKFDISLEEYQDIRFWLNDAGFRWGWDGQDKTRWQLPAQQQNTFIFALQRLLAGYAMSGQHLYHYHHTPTEEGDIAPYHDIEGQRAIALGKLFEFVQLLEKIQHYCLTSDTLENKVKQALVYIEQLYLVEDHEQVYLNQLRQALQSVTTHKQQFPEHVLHDVFVAEVQQNLNEKGVGQRFLAGAVNFCTLMPMRSIPFKHVCMLGMNDADYPRQTVPVGFDLMADMPKRRGDRSRRLDDRYLFLEAIISARSKLYISYLGMSAKDNSPRNPSILVSELVDYCQQVFCLQGQDTLTPKQTRKNLVEHIQFQHALQPFSHQYFEQHHRLGNSFNGQWLAVLKAQQQVFEIEPFMAQPLMIAEEAKTSIELEQLLDFFNNPAKHFFRTRWRTSLQLFHDELLDEEPFELDGLSRYQLNDHYLNQAIYQRKSVPQSPYLTEGEEEGQDDNSFVQYFIRQWQARGVLPDGESGTLVMGSMIARAQPQLDQLQAIIKDQSPRIMEVSLIFQDIELQGWIKSIYAQQLVLFRPGKINGKDKFGLWLRWLCCCATHSSSMTSATFIGIDKSFCLTPVPQEQALQYLAQLVQVYLVGLSAPPMFFPNAAACWLESQSKAKTLDNFAGNHFARGEQQDPNIARICPDLAENFESFCQTSESIMQPMYHFEDGK